MSRMTNEAPNKIKDENEGKNEPLVQKMNRRHFGLLDYMAFNPGVTNRELAAKFDFNESYISQLLRSDLFQMEYRRRRQEIERAQMDELNSLLFGGVKKGIERLTKIVEEEKDFDEDGVMISGSQDSDAIKATQNMFEAMGMGGKNPKVNVDNSLHIQQNMGVTVDMLKEARERRSNLIGSGMTEMMDVLEADDEDD